MSKTDQFSESALGRRASKFIKGELKRRDVTYEKLALRLNEYGHSETQASITAKLSRGMFSAGFFFAVMMVLGKRSIEVDDITIEEIEF